MRPRRVRLGWCVPLRLTDAVARFNEAEARTPRMATDDIDGACATVPRFNEAEARTPRMASRCG